MNRPKKDLKNHIVVIVVLLIILFHAVNGFIILRADNRPSQNDDIWVKVVAIRLYSDLSHRNPLKIPNYADNKPVLLPLLSVPFLKLTNLNKMSFFLTNLFFLSLLLFSICAIGSLLHSKKAGLLAAFIVGCFPQVFGLSRMTEPYFPLICSLTFAIYCLLKTNKFASFKYSLCFGFASGLCALMKTSFSIYLIGPFLAYLLFSVIDTFKYKNRAFSRIKNLLAALILFLVTIIPFYINNWRAFLFDSQLAVTHASSTRPLLNTLTFYLENLFGPQILPFFLVLFLISIFIFIFTIRNYRLLVSAWLFFPWIFYLAVGLGHTDMRFAFSMLPAIAIVIAVAVSVIKNKIARKTIISVVVIVGMIQFILVSYLPLTHAQLPLSYTKSVSMNTYDRIFFGLWHADPYEWEQANTKVMFTTSFSQNDQDNYSILNFAGHFHFSLEELFLESNQETIIIKSSEHHDLMPVMNYDYVVISAMKKHQYMRYEVRYENRNLDPEAYEAIMGEFSFLSNITFIPNDITLSVYKRNDLV